MELPRLLGSAREVDSCAKIWRSNGAQSMVLKGASANKQELAQALRNHPSVVHLAAHMLFPPQEADGGMVALSLQGGEPGRIVERHRDRGYAGETRTGCAERVQFRASRSSSGRRLNGHVPGMAGGRSSRCHRDALAHSDQDSGGVFLSLYRLYFLAPRRWPGVVWSVVAKSAVG